MRLEIFNMQYDTKECGNRIRQLRIKSGLTQERVANVLNIDQSHYGRIELGKKGCSVDLFIQLSALFEVSLDYLILGRCLGDLPDEGDASQLKTDLENVIAQLEKIKLSL